MIMDNEVYTHWPGDVASVPGRCWHKETVITTTLGLTEI
jgi:hypothetical protein